jgi:carboxynorspermidine decarboxylase
MMIEDLRKLSDVKVLLSTECFSTWSVFPLIKKFVDGTTGNSPYEVKLGHQKIGKETHAYSVGYSPEDIKSINRYADKIIFNSISQLKTHCHKIPPHKIGLRVNFSSDDSSNKYYRLGEASPGLIKQVIPYINGAMFHFNRGNEDFDVLEDNLKSIEFFYQDLLSSIKWLSIGGGISFTAKEYPIKRLVRKLRDISLKYHLQVYLEPGEAVVTNCAELVTSIVDITTDSYDTAIIDASTEAHMLNLLTYPFPAKIIGTNGLNNPYRYRIAGRSSSATDIFGVYDFEKMLSIGQEIRIQDAAGYTMVKKNWSNGLQMPSIVVKRLSGKIEVVKKFNFSDFKKSLS